MATMTITEKYGIADGSCRHLSGWRGKIKEAAGLHRE
jgi:hypothetical protein